MNLKKSVPGLPVTHYFGNKRQFDFNTDTLDDIQPHQTYIGFSWFFNSTTRYFVFTVLSCLSTTPSILTKVVCPFILSKWLVFSLVLEENTSSFRHVILQNLFVTHSSLSQQQPVSYQIPTNLFGVCARKLSGTV